MESVLALWAWLLSVMPVTDEIAKKTIGTAIATGLASIAGWISWKLWKACVRFVRWLLGDRDANARLQRARNAVGSGKGLWLTQPIEQPSEYALRMASSIPIITLANLKGGVGKSTITANVAAICALRGESVLVIDLDFQGSLSSMVLGESAQTQRPGNDELSKSSEALIGDKTPSWLIQNAWAYQGSAGSKVPQTDAGGALKFYALTGFYDLARVENRLLVQWLIKDQPLDMPYALAKLLLSDEVRRKYDRIFIDAPPRLSTACIQALCASTHVLMPTVMDRLSAEAIVTFAEELEVQRKAGLCPKLKYLGVVGSMMPPVAGFPKATEIFLTDQLEQKRIPIKLLPQQCWIREAVALSNNAGQRIAVLDGDTADRNKARELFSPLADFIRQEAPVPK